MHAMPLPPYPPSFQRSGSTLKCHQRAPSASVLNTKFVSGRMSKGTPAERPGARRKKYWTCAPGVRRPSGMILVYSYVCPAGRAFPSVGGRPELRSVVHRGGKSLDTGCAPQMTLQLVTDVVVLLLQVKPRPTDGSTTKQRFLAMPSTVYLGSSSWYIVCQLVA